MKNNIKNYLIESRTQEIDSNLESIILDLQLEGLNVEFGKIGKRTTYALIFNHDHSIEIVGYTFIKNLEYYKENLGKLKALQQALARREVTSKS